MDKATEAWVVTNSNFTQQEYELAKSNEVRLIDREQLIEMLLTMKEQISKPQNTRNVKTSTNSN